MDGTATFLSSADLQPDPLLKEGEELGAEAALSPPGRFRLGGRSFQK